MPKTKILIIDDELQIRRLLKLGLEAQNHDVIEAATGREGLGHAATYNPAVILLDLGLPDLTGVEVLSRIREWSKVPVVILSAQNEEEAKVTALDSGADDYVTKPFSMPELLARIRTALRRQETSRNSEASRLSFGSLELDLVARLVRLNGTELKVSAIEYELLKYLAQNPGRILTHRQILKQVWGPQHESDTHYLRVYIGSIRKKIEADPTTPSLIVTEPGIGYRFKG